MIRYGVFIVLGSLFALTGAVAVYNRLSPSQQQHLVCFTHIAADRLCEEWGWKRL